MKETVYLIGGSGFVGKNLAEYFIKDYNVCVFDKHVDSAFFFSEKKKSFSENNFFFSEKDFSKCGLNTDNMPDPDYIINLASVVTAQRDLSLFDSLLLSNHTMLLNLYNQFKDCKTLKLFIQFGSAEEYGNAVSPYLETVREQPQSPYALVKQFTVNTAVMLYANYGFPCMVVRPGNLFGKYQSRDKFIPYVIETLKSGKDLNVTPCEQKRDFIYAEDFAFCIRKIMECHDKVRGEIVNVSGGKSIALKDIIQTLKRLLNSSSQVNYGALPYRENEAMDLKCSVEKFEKLTLTKVDFDIFKRLEELVKQNGN
ncbi:MAG: NAD-dependent epimerase/dehydratase family protein [Bacteroidales bacterium]|nr:NAD-dependent epimerase/dehydratase family protein [Bacteroidales bacterium]